MALSRNVRDAGAARAKTSWRVPRPSPQCVVVFHGCQRLAGVLTETCEVNAGPFVSMKVCVHMHMCISMYTQIITYVHI